MLIFLPANNLSAGLGAPVSTNNRFLIPAGGGCIGVIKVDKYFLTPPVFVDTV